MAENRRFSELSVEELKVIARESLKELSSLSVEPDFNKKRIVSFTGIYDECKKYMQYLDRERELKDQIELLQGQLDAQNHTNTALKHTISTMRELCSKARSRLETVLEELSAANQELAILKKAYTEMEDTNHDLSLYVEELSDQVNQLQNNLEYERVNQFKALSTTTINELAACITKAVVEKKCPTQLLSNEEIDFTNFEGPSEFNDTLRLVSNAITSYLDFSVLKKKPENFFTEKNSKKKNNFSDTISTKPRYMQTFSNPSYFSTTDTDNE